MQLVLATGGVENVGQTATLFLQRLLVLVRFLQGFFFGGKLFFQDVFRIFVLSVSELALQQIDFPPTDPTVEDLDKQGRPPFLFYCLLDLEVCPSTILIAVANI